MPMAQKHAVVIGGARGIGEAIVRRLASDGYTVTIADRLAAEASSLAESLSRSGVQAYSAVTDITDSDSLNGLVQSVSARAGKGGLHAAVNCVGIFDERRTTLKTTAESFKRLLDINVFGAFLFSQAVEPLLGPGASIVHIGSVNGCQAAAELGAYKVSKAALHMLGRCLAHELARDPRRIRVNIVAPGWVDTPGERIVLKPETGIHPLDDPAAVHFIPMGRRIEAREIASAVGFLCSDGGSAITGQILYVDCGTTA